MAITKINSDNLDQEFNVINGKTEPYFLFDKAKLH